MNTGEFLISFTKQKGTPFFEYDLNMVTKLFDISNVFKKKLHYS